MYDVRLPNIRWLEEEDGPDYIGLSDHLNADPTNEQGLIIFYGDSGFTRWNTPKWGHRPMHEDIRMKDGSRAVVNHGFGTSTAEEQLYYYDRLIKPWAPRALVNLTFGNDVSAGYSAGEIMFLQSRLLDYARRDFPGIKLYLCDKRPLAKEQTAARRSITKEYNQLVRAYCAVHEDVTLVCHADCPELFEKGYAGDYDHPRKDIFVADEVHYNQNGYDIYRDFFLKVLDDIL